MRTRRCGSDEPAPANASAGHPVACQALRGIDPNDLRPREALDLLYELHELAAAPMRSVEACGLAERSPRVNRAGVVP